MEVALGLRVRIVNKITDLPQQDWDSVFPKVLENYSFFKTLDESFSDQFFFFYILVYDKNQPVGATSCFIMDFPIDIAVGGTFKKCLSLLKKIFPRLFSFKTLMCGLPMGQGRIGIVKDIVGVKEVIFDTIEKIGKKQKAPLIIYKDFNNSYADMLNGLVKKKYLKVESFPSTDMEINFASFEEYLKTLSPSSRENIKRNLKKVDDKVKIDLTIKNALAEDELPLVYGLYLQTYNKQSMGFEKLPIEFFANVSKNIPQETKFFLWSIDGKLVAFAFCLASENYFIDYYLGFDYEVAHRYSLYLVRFRDLLKWCIEHGIKTYEMGVTTYEPKRRLGFNFIRLYFYMKHRNWLISYFSGLIGHFLKPQNFDAIFQHMDESSSGVS